MTLFLVRAECDEGITLTPSRLRAYYSMPAVLPHPCPPKHKLLHAQRQRPRSDSTAELQTVVLGEERGASSVGWMQQQQGLTSGGGSGGGITGVSGGALGFGGPIIGGEFVQGTSFFGGCGGSSNNLTSGEETDEGFEMADFDTLGGGGAEEGWFTGGHPAVEPKEEGAE